MECEPSRYSSLLSQPDTVHASLEVMPTRLVRTSLVLACIPAAATLLPVDLCQLSCTRMVDERAVAWR